MEKRSSEKVIDIDNVPKEKIPMLFSKWAEGCGELEELLWTCYDKGIKTIGSCAGHADSAEKYLMRDGTEKIIMSKKNPLIAIKIKNGQEYYLQRMYQDLIDSKNDACIAISFNYKDGCVFSANISKKNKKEVFTLLSKAIRDEQKELPQNEEYESFYEYSKIAWVLLGNISNAYLSNNNEKNKLMLSFLYYYVDRQICLLHQNPKELKIVRDYKLAKIKIKLKIMQKLFSLIERPQIIGDSSTEENTKSKIDSTEDVIDKTKRTSWELTSEAKKEIGRNTENLGSSLNNKFGRKDLAENNSIDEEIGSE